MKRSYLNIVAYLGERSLELPHSSVSNCPLKVANGFAARVRAMLMSTLGHKRMSRCPHHEAALSQAARSSTMLEMLLCSLVTLLPDYLYRRYVQGKRFGKEITFY